MLSRDAFSHVELSELIEDHDSYRKRHCGEIVGNSNAASVDRELNRLNVHNEQAEGKFEGEGNVGPKIIEPMLVKAEESCARDQLVCDLSEHRRHEVSCLSIKERLGGVADLSFREG